MQVGVTDTAIEDVYGNIVGAQFAPLEGKGLQGQACIGGGKSRGSQRLILAWLANIDWHAIGRAKRI
jgi:hypothetical protein